MLKNLLAYLVHLTFFIVYTTVSFGLAYKVAIAWSVWAQIVLGLPWLVGNLIVLYMMPAYLYRQVTGRLDLESHPAFFASGIVGLFFTLFGAPLFMYMLDGHYAEIYSARYAERLTVKEGNHIYYFLEKPSFNLSETIFHSYRSDGTTYYDALVPLGEGKRIFMDFYDIRKRDTLKLRREIEYFNAQEGFFLQRTSDSILERYLKKQFNKACYVLEESYTPQEDFERFRLYYLIALGVVLSIISMAHLNYARGKRI